MDGVEYIRSIILGGMRFPSSEVVGSTSLRGGGV